MRVSLCLHLCAHVWLGEGKGDKQKHNFKDNIPDKLISSRLGTLNETESGKTIVVEEDEEKEKEKKNEHARTQVRTQSNLCPLSISIAVLGRSTV